MTLQYHVIQLFFIIFGIFFMFGSNGKDAKRSEEKRDDGETKWGEAKRQTKRSDKAKQSITRSCGRFALRTSYHRCTLSYWFALYWTTADPIDVCSGHEVHNIHNHSHTSFVCSLFSLSLSSVCRVVSLTSALLSFFSSLSFFLSSSSSFRISCSLQSKFLRCPCQQTWWYTHGRSDTHVMK